MVNMKIGYARVSTIGQSLESQIEELKKAGCEKIFQEKVTGKNTTNRDQLKEAIEFCREGDELVVTKIDRLARSIIDLNNIVNELKEKKVFVTFLHQNLTTAGNDNSMDTLLFNILGAFAQFERDLIVQRTSEGRERAKKQGKHMGRPGKAEKDIKRALELFNDRENNGMSVNDIVKLTGVPRATIYKKAQ